MRIVVEFIKTDDVKRYLRLNLQKKVEICLQAKWLN